MEWMLPEMERKKVPGLPAWWLWLLSPLLCVALAGVVLFFVWPVARGYADLRFWFWLLLAPLLCAAAINLFWLSLRLNLRREIAFRHLFIDRKYAQWQLWGRHTLKLAAWHLQTPESESELMQRILKLSGTLPEAPPTTARLSRDTGTTLSASPLRRIILDTLSPMMPVLRSLPVVNISLYISGQSEEDTRQALSQCWPVLFNRSLPASRVDWLAEAPDASLLQHWCNTPSESPRMLLCTRLIAEDEKASEFSAALLFVPHNIRLPEQQTFRPVYIYRPLIAPAAAPEKYLSAMLSVQQLPAGERRHLWDAGLDTRSRNTLLSVLEIQDEPMSVEGQHPLSESVGLQDRGALWQALILATQASDIGQRGQMVAAPQDDQTATVQLSIAPPTPVSTPEDRLSHYPLAWMVATICLLLLVALLPEHAIRQDIWSWLLGGGVLYAALLSLVTPLSLKLWMHKLDDEWAILTDRDAS